MVRFLVHRRAGRVDGVRADADSLRHRRSYRLREEGACALRHGILRHLHALQLFHLGHPHAARQRIRRRLQPGGGRRHGTCHDRERQDARHGHARRDLHRVLHGIPAQPLLRHEHPRLAWHFQRPCLRRRRRLRRHDSDGSHLLLRLADGTARDRAVPVLPQDERHRRRLGVHVLGENSAARRPPSLHLPAVHVRPCGRRRRHPSLLARPHQRLHDERAVTPRPLPRGRLRAARQRQGLRPAGRGARHLRLR